MGSWQLGPRRRRAPRDHIGELHFGWVRPGRAGQRPYVLLECSGNVRATTDAIRIVAPAGRVVLIGIGGDELPLPLSYVQDMELQILGAFRYAGTWPTAIELAASGQP